MKANALKLIARHRVGAVLILLLFPLVMPYEGLAINILIFGLYAVGFNLLFGYTGMLSFGHAAFLAPAATSAALRSSAGDGLGRRRSLPGWSHRLWWA